MQATEAVIRVGRWEGTSFLLLLCVAMPLKYLAGMPLAVRVVGWAHGVLFVAYVATTLWAQRREEWPPRVFLGLLAASIIPLGPFLAEHWLSRAKL